MTLIKTLLSAAIILFSQLAQAECPGGTMNTGWCWPTLKGEWTTNYLGWHGSNESFAGTHLAKDIAAVEGDPIYAFGYGIVLIVRDDVNFYGGATCPAMSIKGGGVIVRHYTLAGMPVDVLYAHLKDIQVKRGDVVTPGSVIAKIRNYTWCGSRMDHLHLGAAYPARDLSRYDGSGTSDVWAGYGTSDRGFVNPVDFFASNSAGNKVYSCNPSTERCLFRVNGPIGWYPPVSDCELASQWFNMATVNGEKTAVGSTTKVACPLVCYAN